MLNNTLEHSDLDDKRLSHHEAEKGRENEKMLRFAGKAALFIVAVTSIAISAIALGGEASRDQTAAAPASIDHFEGIDVQGKAAVVIDIQSGETLYAKNQDIPLPLASLTKVALVLVVADVLPLEMVLTIPYYASGSGGNEHLLQGERWRVQDVIDFTLITSSNNGAEILAAISEQAIRERFPETQKESAALSRMNTLADTLGLPTTHFLNVSGLDLSETLAGSYGSARDVAELFAYAASAYSSLYSGTARNDVLLTDFDGSRNTTASNTNNAQGKIPGLIMGKTGLTDLAGGNLAVVFDVGLAHPIVAVVLGSTEDGRFTDMQKLVEAVRKTIAGVE